MRSVMTKYFLAWFGLMVLAILNGTARDLVYKEVLGPLAAHQMSTVTLLLLFSAALWLMMKAWPIGSKRQAWMVGLMWFVLTEIFEFGMGISRGASWEELLHAYDLAAGQVWIVIPLWVLIAPPLFFRYLSRGNDRRV